MPIKKKKSSKPSPARKPKRSATGTSTKRRTLPKSGKRKPRAKKPVPSKVKSRKRKSASAKTPVSKGRKSAPLPTKKRASSSSPKGRKPRKTEPKPKKKPVRKPLTKPSKKTKSSASEASVKTSKRRTRKPKPRPVTTKSRPKARKPTKVVTILTPGAARPRRPRTIHGVRGDDTQKAKAVIDDCLTSLAAGIPEGTRVVTVANADGSVDGELYIHTEGRESADLVIDLSEAMAAYLPTGQKQWHRFKSLWLRLLAVFVRIEFSEIQTDLPRFKGREQVAVRMNRRVMNHHEVWPALLDVIGNVMAFSEHSFTALLVRLSYTPDDKPPVY